MKPARVEVAKKCDALTAKAFPPRAIGNPAAGSAKGTGAGGMKTSPATAICSSLNRPMLPFTLV